MIKFYMTLHRYVLSVVKYVILFLFELALHSLSEMKIFAQFFLKESAQVHILLRGAFHKFISSLANEIHRFFSFIFFLINFFTRYIKIQNHFSFEVKMVYHV